MLNFDLSIDPLFKRSSGFQLPPWCMYLAKVIDTASMLSGHVLSF